LDLRSVCTDRRASILQALATQAIEHAQNSLHRYEGLTYSEFQLEHSDYPQLRITQHLVPTIAMDILCQRSDLPQSLL